MNEAAALARLCNLTASEDDPVLTDNELDQALAVGRRVDAGGNPPANLSTAASWTADTTYAVGSVVKSASRWWVCLTAGTSGSTEPDWPDLAGRNRTQSTIADNDVDWQDSGLLWTPTWDLNAAAAGGWQIKAGKAAGRFDFTTDGQQFNRSMVVAACRAQAAEYRRKVSASAPTG